ncbi:nuclear transport factor 2 family protein [Flavobacterium enshiense]|uniref:nuclear transport factor 2 family protein n=1 Tax=Flavobacterium enshiense TaxID=1341165 RepID=UPI00345D85CB
MKAKELVTEFYQSDALRNSEVIKQFLHDNMEFHWYSSKGFLKMDKNDLIELSNEMYRSYTSSRINISHILEEENKVSIRYSYFVTPFENPGEEVVLAHFMTIWELKDNKLYRGYQMSQLS